MEIVHTHGIQKLCTKHFLLNTLIIANMATMQRFEVISERFNVAGICTSGMYTYL